MKGTGNSMARISPDLKNATYFMVKPIDNKKGNDFGRLSQAVSKQMKKKKKKIVRNNSDMDLYLTGKEEWGSLDKVVQINQ